jgi:hypothetical protein
VLDQQPKARAMADMRSAAPVPAAPSVIAPKMAEAPLPTPEKGREVAIAAGTLRLGSPTGSLDRNPAREADDVSVQVAAFAIDALPYPNDPSQPFRTGVERGEAARLCANEGKRLCSEFEWERACKGETNADYPSARTFSAESCAKEPLSCATASGIFALGTSGREWTSSRANSGLGDAMRNAVVRGAPADAAARLHRCAARDVATADSKSASLTFRCCRGAESELAYPSEKERPVFEDSALDDLKTVLASMPETASFAADFRTFTGEERSKALIAAGHSRSGMAPWQAAEQGILWHPVRGEELRVVAGDTARGALVVLYYPLAGGKNLFAGSYLTRQEHTALLLAYKSDVPAEILFSSCWGCGGEGGAIQLGDDGRVHIVPR